VQLTPEKLALLRWDLNPARVATTDVGDQPRGIAF
jgi:hypothetical protein